MKRVLLKFGAYTAHIAALSKDTSIKQIDQAKLTVYYKKWTQAKYLLGCAMFVDFLKTCPSTHQSFKNSEGDRQVCHKAF